MMLDRFAVALTGENRQPMYRCEVCDAPIYPGQEYHLVGGSIVTCAKPCANFALRVIGEGEDGLVSIEVA